MKNKIEFIKQKYLGFWQSNMPAMIMIHGFIGLLIIFKILTAF